MDRRCWKETNKFSFYRKVSFISCVGCIRQYLYSHPAVTVSQCFRNILWPCPAQSSPNLWLRPCDVKCPLVFVTIFLQTCLPVTKNAPLKLILQFSLLNIKFPFCGACAPIWNQWFKSDNLLHMFGPAVWKLGWWAPFNAKFSFRWSDLRHSIIYSLIDWAYKKKILRIFKKLVFRFSVGIDFVISFNTDFYWLSTCSLPKLFCFKQWSFGVGCFEAFQ